MFLPRETLDLYSPLAARDALDTLSSALKPFRKKTRLLALSPPNTFQGSVRGNSFRIRREIAYRNDLQPLTQGTIVPCGEGSTLHIDIRIPPGGVFVIFCFSMVLVCTAVLYLMMNFSAETIYNMALSATVPLGLCILGIELTLAIFHREARAVKKFLCETLDIKIDVPTS